MKNNIGIIKAFISNRLKNDFVKTGSLNESKELTNSFYSIIKNSPILKTQLNVFNNLENKSINNDVIATRYIDENISIFNRFTKEEVLNENKKLENYQIDGFECNNSKLYESIFNLILHNTKSDDLPNVDQIHESFVIVLDHIKTEKNEIINESNGIDFNYIHFSSEEVIGLALKKFNEKYNNLDESERKILYAMTFGDDSEKQNVFESLKSESLELLENVDKHGIQDKINETIERINSMKFSNEDCIKNTISLYELKKNLS